jgi:hypothetical protein
LAEQATKVSPEQKDFELPAWFNSTPEDTNPTPDTPDTSSRGPGRALWENLSLFAGLDGAKGPDDLGINANFGLRTHVNWGYPIWEEHGLGIQLGTAFNYAASAVKVLEAIEGTHDRTQSFSTLGIFQRAECGLRWGVAYDILYEDYYANLDLGQWRGLIGYEFRESDEVGLWGAVPEHDDNAEVRRLAIHLEPTKQASIYWRHTWSTQVDTRLWIGMAERHGKFNLVLPMSPPVHDAFLFGAEIHVPLNDWMALFGEASFITPNDTGTVTATLGFVIYPGAKAKSITRSRYAPLLPVANNPTFAVDVER